MFYFVVLVSEAKKEKCTKLFVEKFPLFVRKKIESFFCLLCCRQVAGDEEEKELMKNYDGERSF